MNFTCSRDDLTNIETELRLRNGISAHLEVRMGIVRDIGGIMGRTDQNHENHGGRGRGRGPGPGKRTPPRTDGGESQTMNGRRGGIDN